MKAKPERCPCQANTLKRAQTRRFDCCRSAGIALPAPIQRWERWTASQDEIVLSAHPAEVAERLGRTISSVKNRLHKLRAEIGEKSKICLDTISPLH